MNAESRPPASPPPGSSPPRRLFVFEPGWGVGLKVGSERVFCYAMAPGQDFYHRLLDGEIFVYRGDERLCLACAERRGLISFEPRGLREAMLPLDLISALSPDPNDDTGFDVTSREDEDEY